MLKCLLGEQSRGNGVTFVNLQIFVSVLNTIIAFKEAHTLTIQMKGKEGKT